MKIPRFAFEKFPAADPHAHDADEVGRRGDGDRAHVQGSVPEGAARRSRSDRPGWVIGADARATTGCTTTRSRRCAARCAQPTPERIFQVKRALERGMSVDELARAHGDRSRGSCAQMQRAARGGARGTRRSTSVGRGRRCARMKRLGFSDRQLADLRGETRGRRARAALGARRPAGVQDGRHLRRRVPLGDAVPLRQLRRGERGAAQRTASRS